ncbi:MAG: DUF362 domain-containing protein [bacterium]
MQDKSTPKTKSESNATTTQSLPTAQSCLTTQSSPTIQFNPTPSPAAARVSLVRCPAYEKDQLYPAIQKALDLLGGISQFIKPQDRVLVKVNHLPPPSAPERGIVTHPVFVEQVLIILKESGLGAKVRVGDDIALDPCDGFAVSGLRQVCDRLGVECLSFREEGFKHVAIPNGKSLKETHLARAVLETDVVINLPKFKTHSLAVFTGAVKNIYGCLPSGLRVRYHAQFQGEERFNSLLADLFTAVRPQLNIMDAVVGMEGEGPANGDTRRIGLILASADAVALDRVALAVAGIDHELVFHLKDAARRGAGVYQLEQIQVMGERLEAVRIPDFRISHTSLGSIKKWMPDFLFGAICRQFEARPRVIPAKCRGCGACVGVCPADAIRIDSSFSPSGLARIDKRCCLACMCCHEACRYGAIVPQRKLAGRLLSAGARSLRRLRRHISS